MRRHICASVRSLLALILASALTAPVRAAADVTIVPSPYKFQEGTAFEPVARDAKWDQEVCVKAYHYAYKLDDLPELIADQIARFDADRDERRSRGASEAEIAAARGEMIESLADDEQSFREEAAKHTRNIPKCQGLFFRPALEAQCDEYERTRNQFCAILDGKDIDGVRLTSDIVSFRSALAWGFVGGIVDRGDAAAVSHWSIDALRPDIDVLYTHDEIMDGLEADSWSSDDALEQLDSRLERDASFVMAQSRFVDKQTGALSPHQFGAWALSIEFVRGDAETTAADERDAIAERTRAAGLFPTVGPYLQYPQLHFQLFLYELLLHGDMMQLSVEHADGSRHELSDPAKLAWHPGGVPTLHSSFPTYLSHAFMTPSADDWAALLSPQARQLVVEAKLMGPAGKIEPIAYVVPLGGLKQALDALHQKQLSFDSEYRESIGLIGVHFEEPDCGEPR